MRITDLLKKESISLNRALASKSDAIDALIELHEKAGNLSDKEAYKKEIDFYYPIESWPFPLAQNNEELFGNIMSFDYSYYHKAVEGHHRVLGSYENGHACEKIGKMIIELCK